jgi:hypothetical protein
MGSRGNPVTQSFVFSLAAGTAEISRPMSVKEMPVANLCPFRRFFDTFFPSIAGAREKQQEIFPALKTRQRITRHFLFLKMMQKQVKQGPSGFNPVTEGSPHMNSPAKLQVCPSHA